MDLHQNARSCPASRAVLVERVVTQGWTVLEAAGSIGMSEQRAYVWLSRFRAEGQAGLHDRSSRPHRIVGRTPPERMERALALRQGKRSASEIAGLIGVPRSTVARWLRRHGLGRLRQLAPPEPVRRYQREVVGELRHLDVKKLGRIGQVGHRITRDRRSRSRGIGWEFVHVAIDDASRMAYVEVLEDERGLGNGRAWCKIPLWIQKSWGPWTTYGGGGEYGEEWHQAGMFERKQNVFDDFIAAAEWLIAKRYTSRDRLSIYGGSNGGLLVGAVLNQRPDLFGAAVPAVGVMDMLRYQKFTIGWAWASEYGSSDDPKMLPALRAYSPLHNIKPGACYPPTLITTADHDDRVFPAHSFKYAATLQAAQGCANPILIRIETRAGHGAGRPTAKLIGDATDRLAFLTKALVMPAPRL